MSLVYNYRHNKIIFNISCSDFRMATDLFDRRPLKPLLKMKSNQSVYLLFNPNNQSTFRKKKYM